jgi:hypothetical protein
LKELGIKLGIMEEAFEEGQGPHKAVEPAMVMMMMIPHHQSMDIYKHFFSLISTVSFFCLVKSRIFPRKYI